jgi:hypothetical protein
MQGRLSSVLLECHKRDALSSAAQTPDELDDAKAMHSTFNRYDNRNVLLCAMAA